ncbi:zinc finger and SCAN domain-containing protein 21 isoform X2 [Oncorhynchus kisutch]|uniref:zinc finger and SCAN domain-containing protein 21 isoform X2 n=1 Tax=Oncorhynchus kisutch TaxID=8019 RepID=UPI0009A06393|nr:zinc finger and SCAN domain-containing protein 21 isoform X2 [Oncorhynchus kisutch]
MDVVRLFTNLLAVHRQQLQALAVQGEIQTEALAQLLEKEELRRMEPDVKLEEVKDPEAYLLLLEEADSNSRLSNVKWGLLGGECLRSGEPNYATLRASLQSQVRAEESRRQEDFSYLRYDPERGPRELGQGLESAAQHWLRPERRTAAEVVRCVALQRFVSLLPTHVGECVLKQCPQDMEEAIYMAEEYLNNTPGDKCSEMDNHTDGEGYPADQLREEEAGPAEHQVNSEKMKVTGPGLFLKRIEFSKVCQSSTFNIDARHLEDIYSEERRLDGEDDLVEEDNFSEHEDWIKEEIKYNNQAEVEDEIRSASEMGQSTDVDRNTENVERSQFRNIANQMPVFGRAKRGVSAPVISSSSPNTAEKEGGTPCCLKRKDKEDPFHRPSHCCHDCGPEP